MFRRIKDLREDNNLTQQKVADLLHINRSAYSQYEVGILEIPIDLLIKLSQYYNVSVDYLLELTNNKKPYPHDQTMLQKRQ